MITPQMIKQLFLSAVHNVTAHIKDFSLHPSMDFSRTRKLPPDTLIRLLVAEGLPPQGSNCSISLALTLMLRLLPLSASSGLNSGLTPLKKYWIHSILPSLAWNRLPAVPPRATAALPPMAPPPLSTALPASLPTATSYPKAILRKAFTVFM